MKLSLLSGTLSLIALLSLSPAWAQDVEYQDDALYVRFKQTASPKMSSGARILSITQVESLAGYQKAYGLHQELVSMGTMNQPVLERTFMLRIDSTWKIEQLLNALQQDGNIELVERIPVYYLQGAASSTQVSGTKTETPDPFYEKNNASSLSSWHLDMIHAEEAWAMQTGSAKIKVAVVDNAVWGDHPDLQILPENQYNVASQSTGNSAPPSSVRQDAGCTDANNCVAYNWSHGTHCAGAVGAIRGNGVGIASIGSGLTLMGVSCPGMDASGLAVRDAFQGVSWAASHGAKVISLSWGNVAISETDRAIIQACIDNNIIVVAAAGNNGEKDKPMYPANLPGVISVASVDNNRQISSFSNNGEWVCVAAPGGKIIQGDKEQAGCIFSTTYCTSQRYRLNNISFANGEYYDGMFGTSMATPVVSGLCGLLLSADSTITPYLMREILTSTAQPIAQTTMSAGKNIAPNSGIVDAAAALRLKGVDIARIQHLTAERNGLQIVLGWEKPKSANDVRAYQVFQNNVYVGEVTGNEFSYTHAIDKKAALYRFGVRALYANGDTSLRAGIDVRVPDLYEIEVSVEPAGCGTVTGAGVHPAGTIRLEAQVVEGCTFTRWMEENVVLSREASLDYEVETDARLRAVFSGTPSVGNGSFDKALSVNVYPNPTSGRFILETDGEDNILEIFTIDGVRVARHEHIGNGMEIGLNEPGTYLLRISNRHGKAVRKLVVR